MYAFKHCNYYFCLITQIASRCWLLYLLRRRYTVRQDPIVPAYDNGNSRIGRNCRQVSSIEHVLFFHGAIRQWRSDSQSKQLFDWTPRWRSLKNRDLQTEKWQTYRSTKQEFWLSCTMNIAAYGTPHCRFTETKGPETAHFHQYRRGFRKPAIFCSIVSTADSVIFVVVWLMSMNDDMKIKNNIFVQCILILL